MLWQIGTKPGKTMHIPWQGGVPPALFPITHPQGPMVICPLSYLRAISLAPNVSQMSDPYILVGPEWRYYLVALPPTKSSLGPEPA